MASGPSSPLLRFIRLLAAARGTGELTDGQLLQRFVRERDESAFAALLHRHGPMVLGVCQSILHDAHEAEDAFQATFLVLVRKARSIGKPESVASWLHGVAYRLAAKARADLARRRSHERQAPRMPNPEPDDEVLWRDLRPVLHEEVRRLPERYRAPFVLCYLEGKTNEEAARLLGWPKGTVLSSLARARERLRGRLTRRGLTLSTGVLATVLAQHAAPAAVSPTLLEATARAALLLLAGPAAAASGIAAPVLVSVEGMAKALFLARLKLTAAVLLAAGLVGTGAGLLAYQVRLAARPEAPPAAREPDVVPPVALGEAKPFPEQAAAPGEAKPPEAELREQALQEMQGTWVLISFEQEGKKFKPGAAPTRLVIAGDQYTIRIGEEDVERGSLQLDPTLSPRGVDFRPTNGPSQGKWFPGIYELQGEHGKHCFAPADKERPTAFATRPGSGLTLRFFQREKRLP
jgi:RNA polymerase sigma factor (sigma-70 family)